MPHLLLPVPETVTSHYVIATNEPPADPYAAVPWRVAEPYRRSAIEALKSPRMGIVTIAADASLWRFDDVLAGDDDRRKITESAHQLVVSHRAAAAAQPRPEQTVRAIARALAEATQGVLIDPQARQVVLRDGLASGERDRFRMGDQWFGTRYTLTGADRRLRITLVGLRRFGLPDLVIDRITAAHDLAALNLLRALAYRLLTEQWCRARRRPAQRALPLDDHLTVEPGDFWAFWAATPFAPGRPVTVRLIVSSPSTLLVGPPAGYGGTQTGWLREVLAPAMPPVVGCPADEDAPGSPAEGSAAAPPPAPSRIRF